MKLSISRALPSLFTVGAFVCGFNAINAAVHSNTKIAIIFIFIAGILDLFDGRVARMLGTDSKFGAELDSLSDLVCFGIAGSLSILYYGDAYNSLLFISCCFFSVCTMLRLARFNLNIEYPTYYNNFFIGIPAPAGFMLATMPLCMNFSFPDIALNDTYYAIYLFVISYLMVSTIPTPSTKKIKIQKSNVAPLIAVVGLIITGLLKFPWLVITLIDILYLCIIPFTFLFFLKKRKEYFKQNNN